ncbi:hypoxanthine phosphoribosyltransferase [Clostridium punense]|uniref:Hypoxanthine phosphoribosyltransferase n=1 Tax=Clostridium punense TaxID=1054297 RepID=A0ABS4K5F7_9CLOT|nr:MULTISPECIES: hypoxanthine phosphoribosyltransferase [Clostridium]EQB87304.1 hypoxanthine phosphoribosyltransferase [Clostridium sp. BL8]MBP2023007.1 hypoxanthine phosphoribosyltransferase [Clostridium punense]
MNNQIKEVLLSEEVIKEKVKVMGAKITEDYRGKDLIVLGILKGSVFFMSDLMKEIKIPCKMDFMAVSSYGDATESSGIVKIIKDLDFEIKGKDVLIVEDIIDSGITLKYLMKYLSARNPNSLEIACLLNKPERRKEELQVKYLGFDVPDYFLVGYGLDYAENYRNLPFVGILDEKVYKK